METKTLQDMIATAMFDYNRYTNALDAAVRAKTSDADAWEEAQQLKEFAENEILESLKALEDMGLDIPILKFLRK